MWITRGTIKKQAENSSPILCDVSAYLRNKGSNGEALVSKVAILLCWLASTF